MTELFTRDGFWWPFSSKTDRYLKHMADSDGAIKLCRQRRVAVQAGGHVGLWPLHLSRKFDRVVTFEPDEACLECLRRNCRKRSNIEVHQALLGERAGTGHLLRNASNPGGNKCLYDGAMTNEMAEVLEKHRKYQRGDEALPVMAIDDLGLEGVDLIALDVEGAEKPALMGAARTICRCRPVIMLEQRGHGEVHGYSDADLEGWLRKAGYRWHSKCSKDQIWTPNDG